MIRLPRAYLLTWLALLGLLFATYAFAYLPLGRANLAVAMIISVAKAALVVFIFMKLARGPALTRVFAGAGLFWLAIMMGLAATDYLTRS